MKKLLFLSIALVTATIAFAQSSLEISRDNENFSKVLKGIFTQKELATDTAFSWYSQAKKSFTPNAEVVKQYAAGKDGLSFLVFGGTWCDDTKHLMPNFLLTADAAGVPANHITLIGVDRAKKSLFNLTETFNVSLVPTIIVLKEGKEIGRVVEYGRIGMPEKEVAEIITKAGKK
ncbi:MAG TPA: thioredoxin family protein [Flavisolibacter sp.]|jgi:thiol-disulfide isomerase/thioredoxin|nr:thioredoxin family protein [Flavisolibacter sp.]